MKRLKNYEMFLEAFQAKDKYNAIIKIVNYIESTTGYKLYPYNETFHIKKSDIELDGQLFISKEDLAIRINWIKNSDREEIHSIDLWRNFEFDSNPEFTLELNGNSVVTSLTNISRFINNPIKMVIETEKKETVDDLVLTEGVDGEETNDLLKTQLKEIETKRKRARNPDKKAELDVMIENLKAKIAEDEIVETDSTKQVKSKLKDDAKLNIFKTIELMTIQIARGKSNSLIITGDAGVGKTQTVTETLASFGMRSPNAYVKVTGDISTAGLYEIMFLNRHKLLIFDDCDSVFKDAESVNMLKGALDTYDKREISNMKKTYYDSLDMTDLDMQIKMEQELQAGKTPSMPKQFVFDGKIIFISNIPGEKFDKAILSRSLHVDVKLTKQELLDRMREIITKVLPTESINKKYEALEFLNSLADNYSLKFDLNIRSLIHAVNIRCNDENEKIEVIGGQSYPIWKLLIKQYMIK